MTNLICMILFKDLQILIKIQRIRTDLILIKNPIETRARAILTSIRKKNRTWKTLKMISNFTRISIKINNISSVTRAKKIHLYLEINYEDYRNHIHRTRHRPNRKKMMKI